jgi:hypothetical protein
MRLAQKLAPAEAPKQESLTQKVKDLAKSTVEKVEGALHAAAEKIKDVVGKKP